MMGDTILVGNTKLEGMSIMDAATTVAIITKENTFMEEHTVNTTSLPGTQE